MPDFDVTATVTYEGVVRARNKQEAEAVAVGLSGAWPLDQTDVDIQVARRGSARTRPAATADEEVQPGRAMTATALSAREERMRAMLETLDAELRAALPHHFSIGLMRGRIRSVLSTLDG